jgi:hypothetical protein
MGGDRPLGKWDADETHFGADREEAGDGPEHRSAHDDDRGRQHLEAAGERLNAFKKPFQPPEYLC